MEGFDEVTKRFPKAANDTLRLYGKTYGLPNTMTFLMMFYRMDILADLNVEVPRTWDDLKNIIPVLQTNNMTIGFPSKIAGTKLFLYQMGGEMYADDGKRINLSSNVALSAFTELTDLFQSYRFPLTYEPANRFRTGEMPILIADYITLYNQLTVFAPEIDGLWEFISLPGFVDENGEINNCSVVTTEGVCLMKGAEDNPEDCWKFLEWFTRGNVQANYSNELVAVVGQSSKNATANTEALSELPWSSREYDNLMEQFEKTVGITEYPGGYIITRYVDFAFMDVYNDGANATEAMLDYVTEINKEITRKRKEFGFDYLEISYSNSADYIESE
jgi:ABC-type glycerol-3-phosphate transport system substrate-binding protein